MRDLFWLREGEIAGSSGPNRSVWELEELALANIRGVLSLNDGALIREHELEAAAISYARHSLPDSEPPTSVDVEACSRVLPEALGFVQSVTRRGGAVLVHCNSGKDRTGLFLCYYLCKVIGCDAHQAIAEVKKVRSIALSARGWEELAVDVLSRVS